MAPRPGRSLGLVLSTVAATNCGGGTGATDAAMAVAPDGPSLEVAQEAPLPPPRPDARLGLSGGSACDASAQCLSGACPMGTCSEWSHAMRIGIDTTASGADVRQSVQDFPLLVRLAAPDFPFDEARPAGADLRFVDGAGATLAHEIERWDAEAGTADVWVLLPRIEGDSRENFFLAYWGNPLAPAVSSGRLVFEPFACVLHMQGEMGDVASRVADSSGHDSEGLLQNPENTATLTQGVAGPGLGLDGQATYLTIATRMTMPPPITVSLWFRTTSTTGGGLAGLANWEFGDDAQFDRVLWMDDGGRLAFAMLTGSSPSLVASLTGYHDGAWHLAVARVSAAGLYLFVDGEPVADDPGVRSTAYASGHWRLGGAIPAWTTDPAPAHRFQGVLDEVRITGVEESDAWIKLAYATQRPGATAVSYQRIP
jgi:biopolymer transport protein ExbB